MPVPYTFATATSAIPLSQLDNNFATAITIGNTAVQLGNTITTINNLTLANVVISSGSVNNVSSNGVTLTNVTISSVTAPITVAEGGTGLTTLPAHNVLVGNAAGTVVSVAPGTSANVLTSNGTDWVSQAPVAATGNVTIGNTTISLGGTTSTLGNLSMSNVTITAAKETQFALTSNNINLLVGNYFTNTVSATTTFAVSNIAASGTVNSFILDLTNGGSQTVNWFSNVTWAGGTAPTLTASGRDVLGFFTENAGTTWNGFVLGKAMA
jgi:hypothetical protein